MTLSSGPRLLKAALAIVDPVSGSISQVIPFQFNPTRMKRELIARDIDPEGDPNLLVRLSGPPLQTLSFEAFLDATDALEEGNGPELEHGLAPRLAALEGLITPSLTALLEADALADEGALELLPAEAALTLLVWNTSRIQAVRVDKIAVEEELYDQNLNPLRARVTLSVTVLTTDDLGVSTKAGGVYLNTLANQERLNSLFQPGGERTATPGAI